MISLQFQLSQPPSNISTQKLFSKIVERIDQEMPTDMKQHVISEPLFTKTLNESQWKQLSNVSPQIGLIYAIILTKLILSFRLPNNWKENTHYEELC